MRWANFLYEYHFHIAHVAWMQNKVAIQSSQCTLKIDELYTIASEACVWWKQHKEDEVNKSFHSLHKRNPQNPQFLLLPFLHKGVNWPHTPSLQHVVYNSQPLMPPHNTSRYYIIRDESYFYFCVVPFCIIDLFACIRDQKIHVMLSWLI